jgi:hypothetical protein
VSDKKDQSYNINDITLGWEAPCPAQEYVVQSDLCNMSSSTVAFTTDTTSIGITAQEVGDVYISSDTITLGAGAVGHYNYAHTGLDYINTSGINFSSSKSVLRTSKNEIDLDELADLIKVLKKRLLILTPDFEKHEKYPMLKELYNEYKAMERLLGGPDSSNDNE